MCTLAEAILFLFSQMGESSYLSKTVELPKISSSSKSACLMRGGAGADWRVLIAEDVLADLRLPPTSRFDPGTSTLDCGG